MRYLPRILRPPGLQCQISHTPVRWNTHQPLHVSQNRVIQSGNSYRYFQFSSSKLLPRPTSYDRGPKSEEDTVTDFNELNVLGTAEGPTTGIDACTGDGFHLNNGLKIIGSGALLVAGEAFTWKPWETLQDRTLVNARGQWQANKEAWGIFDIVWPKPELLILGVGPAMRPVSPETRAAITALGIRLEIQDTRNAAAQYNLLATERGIQTVAAALVPIGWKDR